MLTLGVNASFRMSYRLHCFVAFERSMVVDRLNAMQVKVAVELVVLDAMEPDSHRPIPPMALGLAEFVHMSLNHLCMYCLDLRLLRTFRRRHRTQSCNANRTDDFVHFVSSFGL